MEQLKEKALRLGAEDFGQSKAKDKRFYVVYQGKKINFGSKTGSTYLDHKDDAKRDAWIARHSKIKNKHGDYVMGLKTSGDWWAKHLLW